jgi:YVTN family beta-propeller protein
MRRRGDAGRALATVLFTDIVGSTELASELGDERWKQVLATHHGVVRKTLKHFNGREIDTAGDGFFATFSRPADAIRCAQEIIDQLRQIGIHIRAGIHMGEVEQMGPKVGGIAVHIGSRVASKADASEILVSSTIRDLVAGSDIRFTDRGAYDLKGVPGEWHLYSIDRQLAPDAPAKPIVDAPAAKAARRRTVPAVGLGAAALVLAVVVAAVAIVASRGSETGTLKAPEPDTIARLDAGGHFSRVTKVGSRPSGVAVGGRAVWAINADDRTLSRVDPSGKQQFSPIAVGGSPTGIAYGAGSVWITTEFGLESGAPGSVLRFDTGTKLFGKPIAVGSGVRGVAFGEGSVWVTNAVQGTVTRIDPATNAITSVIRTGRKPEAIAAGDGAVWVADSLDSKILKIDPATDSITATIPVLAKPSALAVGTEVWVVSESGNVLIGVDPRTSQVTRTVRLEGGPNAVAATGNDVWVGEARPGAIAHVKGSDGKVVSNVPVEGNPVSVAVEGDGVWFSVVAS